MPSNSTMSSLLAFHAFWWQPWPHGPEALTSFEGSSSLPEMTPSMVCVLPAPVWPYAKMEELYPAMQCSTMGRPTTAGETAKVEAVRSITGVLSTARVV